MRKYNMAAYYFNKALEANRHYRETCKATKGSCSLVFCRFPLPLVY